MSGVKLPCVTDLAETAAVYAVCNRHYAEALRIIRGMTPTERTEYGEQLQALLDLIATANHTTPGASQ